MIGKRISKTQLFHPNGDLKIGVPRGLTLANSMLLTLALGVFLNDLFKLRIHIILILIITILFSALIMLFDQNKDNILCYFIIIGIFIAGAIIGKVLKFNYVNAIQNVYEWCLSYDREIENYQRWNGLAVMAGILFLSCIITYVIHRYKVLKNYLAGILYILLIIASIKKLFIPKITVGVVIVYSMIILVEFCGKRLYKSSNKVDNGIATIYLAPVCLIIAMTAILLPSNTKPIQWNGVKRVIHKVQVQGSQWVSDIQYFFDKSGTEFAISFSGYSDEEDELGGDVNMSDNISLLVTSSNRSTSRGYLMGSISDVYTGRNWGKSDIVKNNQIEDYNLDFYELLIAFAKEQKAGSDLTNIIKQRSYEIEYQDIRTKTLFYPLKTYKINFSKVIETIETGQGTFLFEKAKGVGTKYEVRYYELNLNSELLQNMFKNGGNNENTVSEENLLQAAKTIFDYNTSGFTMDLEGINQELVERSNKIKANYTNLPKTLPIRVKQLAYELTKDYNNDYDKLKAIEAYLNTLTYTTQIGKTPKGEDFVDYFLFEQQQGYCTYFASAMGILARSIGIPTRYVEGFVIDYKEKDSKSTYKVLSRSAHSWIDAYVEGIGWIPFEPTPTFYIGRYTTWKDNTSSAEYHDSGVAIGENLEANSIYQDLLNEVKEEYSEVPDKRFKAQYAFIVILLMLSTILLFVGIIVAYYELLVKKYYKRFKNATNNVKLSLTIMEVLRYLNKEGFKLAPEETLLSYALRIGDRINFNSINLLVITRIFMEVRYGEKEVKEEELHLVMQFRNQYEKHLYEKLGKRKMFFDRFVFLHFYK